MSDFEVEAKGSDFTVTQLLRKNEALQKENESLRRQLAKGGGLPMPAMIKDPQIAALADGSYDPRN